IRESNDQAGKLSLPMQVNNRSLNLSNSAAIVVYEAWRQCNFQGQA
ncbi:MAG: tRNA (uridine(34)/cytosine(34)/5-carboxymethylaminomethyluridine(34)-2'-O)-methyltransferase TrmL, partial [Desulfobacterales bacterium]|nr:tRNA (uridine(34)/cytosine(34)/5-carboxymethylaminomethyluridine(34)-2'-O)-methyltransferase TrmL [Desulfobacterales bacterium]